MYFRAGTLYSPYINMTWDHNVYNPSVIIINLGINDFFSFHNGPEEYALHPYGESAQDLEEHFISTYVAFVHQVHKVHPKVPIFITRPFNGLHEKSCHDAVLRLNRAGDNIVYWVDTLDWMLDFEKDFHDDHVHPSEIGNKKAALRFKNILCPFLSSQPSSCEPKLEPMF